jgi:hypothetical protein
MDSTLSRALNEFTDPNDNIWFGNGVLKTKNEDDFEKYFKVQPFPANFVS